MAYLVKLILTAAVVALASEVAKRNVLIGGVLASIPLISVLTMVWLYVETKDAGRVAALASSIFWLVLPSLLLFVLLPLLLRSGLNFYVSLLLSSATTAVGYGVTVWALGRLGGAAAG